ncbi:unnamed protein product [Leptosia nina]|uniref:Uncharacterized protein n=1 Tax=Leptosia nina TaxID=320188 RepID=A0AAV1K2E3_9NEOP
MTDADRAAAPLICGAFDLAAAADCSRRPYINEPACYLYSVRRRRGWLSRYCARGGELRVASGDGSGAVTMGCDGRGRSLLYISGNQQ